MLAHSALIPLSYRSHNGLYTFSTFKGMSKLLNPTANTKYELHFMALTAIFCATQILLFCTPVFLYLVRQPCNSRELFVGGHVLRGPSTRIPSLIVLIFVANHSLTPEFCVNFFGRK